MKTLSSNPRHNVNPTRISQNINNQSSNELSRQNKLLKMLICVLISTLVFAISGTGLMIIKHEVNNKEKNDLENSTEIVTSTPNLTLVPTPSPYSVIYPNSNILYSGGGAFIKDENTYDYYGNQNFILVLTGFRDGVEHRSEYVITLNGSYDSVSEPVIAYKQKYGCVTLQASGYSGFYIFDIEKGEWIAGGDQYSRCVKWIDENRVIIWENKYNTKLVTHYIFNASTKEKTILSSMDFKEY